DPDDEPRGHSRFVPARARHRAGRANAATARHHGHRRADRQHAVYAHDHSGRLSALGTQARRAGRDAQIPADHRPPRAPTPRRTRMKTHPAMIAAIALASPIPAAEPSKLELVQTIVLKGKAGKLDHLTLDAKRDRLFLANTVNGTLDVVDLKAGKLLK